MAETWADVGTGSIVRKSGLLLVARGLQAAVGAVTFVILTRWLGPRGFGEVVTAFGLASLVGGVLSAALSDSAIVAPTPLGGLSIITRTALVSSALGTALAWWVTGGNADAILAVAGTGLFVAASAASALPTAAARRAGRAKQLAFLQVVGSLATLAATLALALSGVREWGAFLLPYAAQPAALLLLREVAPPAKGGPGGDGVRDSLRRSAPFLVAQAVWPIIAQTNVLVLRALRGAAAVGIYGAMARVLELVAVTGPLLGTFALPAFHRLHERGPGSSSTMARANLVIATVSTMPILAAIPLAWLVWGVLYPNQTIPTVTFALLAGGYGASNACGLPDRILQAAGRSSAVARGASVALGALVVMSPPAVYVAGLRGGAVALLVVLVGVNVALLAQTRPDLPVVLGHLRIALVVGLSAAVTATGVHEGSIAVSVLLGLIGPALVAADVLVHRHWHPSPWAP